MAPGFRVEKDALGSQKIPENAHYGIFTQRAIENFQISGIKAPRELIMSLGMIKKATVEANVILGLIDRKIARAISSACDEVISGKYDSQFPVDVFQAGAGTPFNMNANEVIANLALEKLGKRKGDYEIIHPNNHVNMSQSTNDVIPTAMRLSCMFALGKLVPELIALHRTFMAKAHEFDNVLKIGRTHLQDAVPIRFGQVFDAYAIALQKVEREIKHSSLGLMEIGLGGTAIGTGVTAHPRYRELVTKELAKITKLPIKMAKSTIETTWDMQTFVSLFSALKLYAIEINKICNDLKLLNSGPNAGFAEIFLPEVEPGSSIMPGKVNPSILEATNMVCYQVIGNSRVIEEAAENGQLELNTMTPLIIFDLLWSLELLTNATKMLNEKGISGIKVNEERCKHLLEESTSIITALNPYIGYEVGAEIVKIALKENRSIKSIILENRLIDQEILNNLLDAKKLTSPQQIDIKLTQKIKSSDNYKRFKEKFILAK